MLVVDMAVLDGDRLQLLGNVMQSSKCVLCCLSMLSQAPLRRCAPEECPCSLASHNERDYFTDIAKISLTVSPR
jgi:hypothetical protein